jgi:hypothetical protein
VYDVQGGVIVGVKLSLDNGTLTTYSSVLGAYIFSNLRGGTYLVNAELAGWTFTPLFHTVFLQGRNVTGVDFIGIQGGPEGNTDPDYPGDPLDPDYPTFPNCPTDPSDPDFPGSPHDPLNIYYPGDPDDPDYPTYPNYPEGWNPTDLLYPGAPHEDEGTYIFDPTYPNYHNPDMTSISGHIYNGRNLNGDPIEGVTIFLNEQVAIPTYYDPTVSPFYLFAPLYTGGLDNPTTYTIRVEKYGWVFSTQDPIILPQRREEGQVLWDAIDIDFYGIPSLTVIIKVYDATADDPRTYSVDGIYHMNPDTHSLYSGEVEIGIKDYDDNSLLHKYIDEEYTTEDFPEGFAYYNYNLGGMILTDNYEPVIFDENYHLVDWFNDSYAYDPSEPGTITYYLFIEPCYKVIIPIVDEDDEPVPGVPVFMPPDPPEFDPWVYYPDKPPNIPPFDDRFPPNIPTSDDILPYDPNKEANIPPYDPNEEPNIPQFNPLNVPEYNPLYPPNIPTIDVPIYNPLESVNIPPFDEVEVPAPFFPDDDGLILIIVPDGGYTINPVDIAPLYSHIIARDVSAPSAVIGSYTCRGKCDVPRTAIYRQ